MHRIPVSSLLVELGLDLKVEKRELWLSGEEVGGVDWLDFEKVVLVLGNCTSRFYHIILGFIMFACLE